MCLTGFSQTTTHHIFVFWPWRFQYGKKLSLSLVGFNNAFNTIRLYKCPCQECIQTVLSGNHKTKSAVLFRLITQTKDTPKKAIVLPGWQTHEKKKWKRTIVKKIEKKLQFPYVFQAQYEHRTAAADTQLQYHCDKNKEWCSP